MALTEEQKLTGVAILVTAIVLILLVSSSKTMTSAQMNKLTIIGLIFSAVVSAWTLAFVNMHAKEYKAQGKDKDVMTINILNGLYLALILMSGVAMYKYMKA